MTVGEACVVRWHNTGERAAFRDAAVKYVERMIIELCKCLSQPLPCVFSNTGLT